MSAALTALTVAAKVATGAAAAGGTAVVEVVRGVVVLDGVTVDVLVEVDVAMAAGGAGTVESAADEESDDVGELRAVELVPPQALSVSRGSATEIALRSQ
jgi:hypothetical protein